MTLTVVVGLVASGNSSTRRPLRERVLGDALDGRALRDAGGQRGREAQARSASEGGGEEPGGAERKAEAWDLDDETGRAVSIAARLKRI